MTRVVNPRQGPGDRSALSEWCANARRPLRFPGGFTL